MQGSASARVTVISDEVVKKQVENRAAKQQAEICVRKGCWKGSADGSDYCEKHGQAQRQYNAAYMARQRAEWESEGLCTNCGKHPPKPDSNHCPGCLILRGKVPASVVKSQVENHADRVTARLIPWSVAETRSGVSPTNANRVRLRGGKRGVPSKAESDAAALRDMRRYTEKADVGLALATSPEVKSMGKITRDDANQAWLSWLALLVRTALETLRRHHYEVSLEPASEE